MLIHIFQDQTMKYLSMKDLQEIKKWNGRHHLDLIKTYGQSSYTKEANIIEKEINWN